MLSEVRPGSAEFEGLDIDDIVVDSAIVEKYRRTFSYGDEIGIAEVERHWRLERALTKRLLCSTPETRWQVFADCYTEFFADLPWLNRPLDEAREQKKFARWGGLIRPGSLVFEVGSGRAGLLKYLTRFGCRCVATEITPERGEKHLPGADNLTWRHNDGVNLARFEPENTYDFVISTQVVEHFHPDDTQIHFANALAILKPGGEYIFDTPHRGAGPYDLSFVFGCDRAVCMHLKEYDYAGLIAQLRAAGFSEIRAIVPVPRIIKPFRSWWYLTYCRAWDAVLHALRLSPSTERGLRRRWLRRGLLVPTNIWLAARKPL